jgi:hypothetical protein
VALALGNAGDPEAFPALLLILDDSNPIVQRAAVIGLATYLENHPQEEYRRKVLEELNDVLEHRCRRYEDGLLKIEICHALEHIEVEQSKELLLKLTLDVDFDVRKMAILALASFRAYAESLTHILLKFLEDTHWSVREAAVTALGLLGTDNVESELFELLEDPDITVRKALLITMGQIGSAEVIPVLVQHLAHDELDYSAYQGLTILAERYRDQLVANHTDKNPKVNLYLNHILEQH